MVKTSSTTEHAKDIVCNISNCGHTMGNVSHNKKSPCVSEKLVEACHERLHTGLVLHSHPVQIHL